MKYQTQILQAFDKLGFKPRDNQIEFVNKIVEAFIDNEKKNCVLCAPTGTGKSIIAAVAAEVLASYSKPSSNLASFILMGTNVLAKQYSDTFKGHQDFIQIKGAGQYPCGVLSDNTTGTPETAESCAIQLLKDNGLDDVMQKHCWKCEYRNVRDRKNTTRHLITNYSYFFVDSMYANTLDRRKLTIWDEAHTINDVFTEHNAIYFSVKRLNEFAEEITENLKLGDLTVFNTFKKVREDLKAGKINENNYIQYLTGLHKAYSVVSENAQAAAASSIKNFGKYTKLQRIYRKYFGLGCKIDDLINYQYEHVFEHIEKENAISVKPIFVGTMFKQLNNSEFNLFMSATVSERYLIETLALDPKETTFIKLPPSFPKENKRVVFLTPINLNYKSLQEDKIKNQLRDLVEKIVVKHTADKESGIILTPSFDLTRIVCDKLIWSRGVEVLEHCRGDKLAPLLEQFKKSKVPAVLISPSLFEGIDLPGEQARYAIICKAPYGSLADKRMKFILAKHPQIYELLTTMKLVQGAGRGVRSMDDWCATYMLDTNIQRLWNSSSNVWKDEFSTVYSQFI